MTPRPRTRAQTQLQTHIVHSIYGHTGAVRAVFAAELSPILFDGRPLVRPCLASQPGDLDAAQWKCKCPRPGCCGRVSAPRPVRGVAHGARPIPNAHDPHLVNCTKGRVTLMYGIGLDNPHNRVVTTVTSTLQLQARVPSCGVANKAGPHSHAHNPPLTTGW